MRNGVRLAYREAGHGDVPVVLHTGGAGAGSMWEGGGYALRLDGMRLVLYDHRGRGASDRPPAVEAHRREEYVQDVVALADHLGAERYAFVGYSLGAAVGLVLAARDPRLAGLVALGCVFDPPDEAPSTSDYQAAPIDGMAAVVRTIEESEQLTLPDWALREFMETDPEQFQLTLAANAAMPDPWDLLEEVGTPAVLIAGSLEDPDRTQDAMAARMPQARSVHVAGAGHVGAFLRPDDVCAAALPLLRDVTG